MAQKVEMRSRGERTDNDNCLAVSEYQWYNCKDACPVYSSPCLSPPCLSPRHFLRVVFRKRSQGELFQTSV
jgi:hypothetical protein